MEQADGPPPLTPPRKGEGRASFPIFQPVKTSLLKHAKSMRLNMTEPERKLWKALRWRLRPKRRFRRQVPIGPYIVNFCCLAEKLVVEVDGNQHGTDDARRYDEIRTQTIASHGFRVLRFANEDVVRELDSVLDTIAATLDPPPNPAAHWPAEEHHAHG